MEQNNLQNQAEVNQELSSKKTPIRRLQKSFGHFLCEVGQILIEEDDIDAAFYNELQTCTSAFQMMKLVPQNERQSKEIQQNVNEVEEEKDSLQKTQPLFSIVISFGHLFQDFEGSLTETIDILNIEAEELGFKFKMGSFSQKEQKKSSYAYLYCKERHRLADPSQNQKKQCKKSSKKNTQNRCMAYIGFKLKSSTKGIRIFFFHSENSTHNHGPKTYQEISNIMISQIMLFRRRRPISDIVNFLEHKNPGANLSYNKVYYQFRKLRPLLNEKDVHFFVSFLQGKNAYIETFIDSTNQHMCRLLFCTEIMQENYKKFGDIMLIDATYKTNKYQIPLVAFTGISSEAKNVLFGLCLPNDETYQSYKWALEMFFKNNRTCPKLIITDQDAALTRLSKSSKAIIYYVNGISPGT